MATLSQRIEALEKLIADLTPIAPVQFIVLDIGRDAPEEYERKKQQIAAIEAKGERIIVYDVVGARRNHGNA
ncbi:MAG: hypothetical protein Q7S69_07450 [Nitrosomonadaceae bacterium]|nr:hypothetical protein [Nitrosomonadaceae bacterium]